MPYRKRIFQDGDKENQAPLARSEEEASPTKEQAVSSQESVGSVLREAKDNSSSLTPERILQLQRTIGNARVQRLINENHLVQRNGRERGGAVTEKPPALAVDKTPTQMVGDFAALVQKEVGPLGGSYNSFVNHVAKVEFSSENTDFLKKVMQYKGDNAVAMAVYNQFIADGAPQLINLTSGQFATIRDAVKQGPPFPLNLFNEAIRNIVGLLSTDSLPRYSKILREKKE